MPHRAYPALVLAITLTAVTGAAAAVSAPVEKWRNGGCSSFCQTGWYASPAVADLDGNGTKEVIWGGYDLVAMAGTNKAQVWRAPNGSRIWPGIAVADLTGDGTLEVIVGRGSDQVTVYDRLGNVVWTRNPFGSGEVRSLAVADLENDGQLEIIVGRASGGSNNQINVYEPNGTVRPGWPARRNGELGNGWGMYNENVAVGDLDGDGLKEVIGPTDTHYITALDRGGNQLPVNSRYTGRQFWSEVGVHVDDAVDVRGFANCGTEHRPNFANSAPAIADVNGDGVPEVIVVGNVYNCGTDPYTDLYNMPFLLKRDRTRWSGSGFDWTVIPTPGPGSGPLSEDFDVIENDVPNPVVADLDGDCKSEVLFPSYDGKMHAYWLDKTEHGNWPFVVPGAGMRFAGEPVVADLDNDGHAEVLFTSWPQKGSNLVGQLHVLDYLGNPLYAIDLPPDPDGDWNGGLGAPTIADIDGDPDLELVVGTHASGVVAYDLPNTANARVLWGTGRGSYRRTGTPLAAAGPTPSVSISDVTVSEGNAGSTPATFTVSLSAPTCQAASVNYATASGTASSGSDFTAASGTVTFPASTTSQNVSVSVLGDVVDEPNETFTVNLSAPNSVSIGDGQGQATILDDDPTPQLSISDCSVGEGQSGSTPCTLNVSLSGLSSSTITVNYASANGTATAGSDYTAASGTLTFPPVTNATQAINVPVLGDLVFEPSETFSVNLTSPSGATIADGTGQGTIVNDDPVPSVVVDDCAVVEGNAGTTPCTFSLTLSNPSSTSSSVSYATGDGSATAPSDYTATSGSVTFPALSTGPQTVAVSVLGDTAVEGDQTFFLDLSSPSGVTIPDSEGLGTILDDDAPSLSVNELAHGSNELRSLAPGTGPQPGDNVFRIAQQPFSSYEVVVDATSGDIGPGLLVQRLDSDNTTVLQTGSPVGTGQTVSLRWQNGLPAVVSNQHIRVRSNGCTATCGTDDVYRIRVYDTTYSVPRFNNSGTQVTVLIIQNPTSATVNGNVRFWSAAGAVLSTRPFSLAARGTMALNGSTIAELAGKSGSITVSHDGGFGALAGKAVALEPSTGFSFDTTLTVRAR